MNIPRVGIGFDFHRLERGRRLILGGVEIPFSHGLAGHSDSDALLHAIADAMLGAAGLSDIGSYFPDTDPRWEGVSSLLLLEKVRLLVQGKGLAVANLDSVLIAQAPRLVPHVPAMKASIARVLNIDTAQIGIKATTMEGLGVIGREEGIAAQAVVLLCPASRP